MLKNEHLNATSLPQVAASSEPTDFDYLWLDLGGSD